MNSFQTRVVTKDLKIVKVEPVAFDSGGFGICYVDEQGILHYNHSYLSDLLKIQADIITKCGDLNISDEDLLNSTKNLIAEFE